MKPHLIVITGPTASGKSALAVEVARRLKTEIVSADSRQIYRDIPIVTAAPTPEEMAGIEHHLVGFLPLESRYSAARFEKDALDILNPLMQERGVAIVCGGSMLYIDALCNGIDELPTVPLSLREELTMEHKKYGDARLRMRLLALDPVYYQRVDLNNMARVFHAVEVSIAAGKPYSSLLGHARPKHDFRITKIMLTMPREILFERINRRVQVMADIGAIEEVRSVANRRELNALNTVGVKELLEYLDGRWTLDFALARMAKNTRVYAKKQMTWFKRDPDIIEVDASGHDLIEVVMNVCRKEVVFH